MKNTEQKFAISKKQLTLANIVILSLVYMLCYWLRKGTLSFSTDYLILLFLYVTYWIFLSFYHNKFRLLSEIRIDHYRTAATWSAAYSLFFLTLTISIVGLLSISRAFVLYIIMIALLIEFLFSYYLEHNYQSNTFDPAIESGNNRVKNIVQLKYILPSAVWLGIIFFILVWIKTDRLYYYYQYEKFLLVLYASWSLSTSLTYRYSKSTRHNIYYFVGPHLKAGILMLFFVGVFYYFFRLEPLSRFLLFGTTVVHTVLEMLAFASIFLFKNVELPGHGAPQIEHVSEAENQLLYTEKGATEYTPRILLIDIVNGLVPGHLVNTTPYKDVQLSVQQISDGDVQILKTESIFNIEVLKAENLKIILNIELLNNIRRINKYILSVHSKLKPGGYLVGSFIALEDDWLRLRRNMPKSLFLLLYPLYFTVNRVFPKLPILKTLYFSFTRGKDRKISRSEVWGRLAYCGFKMTHEVKSDEIFYFVAQKVKVPSTSQNPSYGPIIGLNRIGYHGRKFKIYKFRTMHPYSEFIQKEIFKTNSLNNSGKLQDDFRVTTWGKFIRKLWIDETPQLLNWLRGDVSFVGVRALSEHYFSLYPNDLKELRTQFKPGLIPPYYADLPQKFNQILESERRYLLKKKQQPFQTDFIYFWRAIYNILIKGARSS